MTTFHGQMNGAGLRIALVCSRFNDLIVGRLEAGARHGVGTGRVGDPDGRAGTRDHRPL